jgi:[acyl-carrier-protein] S-malonyltransferase
VVDGRGHRGEQSVNAYLFPGRLDTAWAPTDFATQRPDLYEIACTATGADPFLRAFEDLRFSEPVLVALALARWGDGRDGSAGGVFVGCSTGELAALAVGGALSDADAIWLAAVRGRLASEVGASVRLVAVALRETTAHQARQLAASHDLSLATDNAPHELILIGRQALVAAASRTARQLGVAAAPVPPHRALPAPELATARREWRAALEAAEMRQPRFPVFSCTTVNWVIDPRSVVAEGLTACVRQRQARAALARLGVRHVVDVGAPAGGGGR